MSIDSFQPPSPSLSPTSQIRCYQTQIEKAHSMIDQLEMIIHEKSKNNENVNTLNMPIKQNHGKKLSLNLDYQSGPPSVKAFITPRESQTSTRNSIIQRSPLLLPSYIQELQQKHQELVQSTKELSVGKENKIQEIQDLISEVKDELIKCREIQRVAHYEKHSTTQNIQTISREIENANKTLAESKEFGKQLENILQQLDVEREQQEVTFLQNCQQIKRRKRGIFNSENKPNKKLKEQIQNLRAEIYQLKSQKQEYEEYFENRIRILEEQLNMRTLNVDELNASLSPNQKAVRICKGSEVLMQIRLSQMMSDKNNYYSSDARIKTVSDFKIKKGLDEDISVQSFHNQKQNRSCESCVIF
ncbi:hypothetical protein pb186bvf_014014 [Paramecium bursaria]